MAKIKLSALVSEMRGKLNGSVFSKNRGGAYLRTKVTPVNPQSISQGNVRATLTALSQAWRALTEAERLAWAGAVSSFTGTDIFGDIKTPSGINLYIKLNLNLANIGEAPINTPPLAGSVGYFSALSLAADASASTIAATFTDVDVTAGMTVVVEATANISAGKSFVKSEFRKIGTFVGGSASPQAIGAMYVAKFGAMTAGKKLFVRFKCIDNVTGISGQYTTASTIVVA